MTPTFPSSPVPRPGFSSLSERLPRKRLHVDNPARLDDVLDMPHVADAFQRVRSQHDEIGRLACLNGPRSLLPTRLSQVADDLEPLGMTFPNGRGDEPLWQLGIQLDQIDTLSLGVGLRGERLLRFRR
jgi:hypothetical protein